ncbi:MAG: hypothetical protein QXK24_08330 [Ignisphaera sp.]
MKEEEILKILGLAGIGATTLTQTNINNELKIINNRLSYLSSNLKNIISEALNEELRLSNSIPLIPHIKDTQELKSYAERIGSSLAQWNIIYDIFVWKDTAVALVGRLPSGLYDVESHKWIHIENRKYYEAIGGVAISRESEVVGWTSWDTPYMFLWNGKEVKMVDIGKNTGGNIVSVEEDFYTYRNDGKLIKVTPDGTVTEVSQNPNHNGATCWMAKSLGSKLFFPTPYPDRRLYSYDLNTGTWTIEKEYGGTIHDPRWAYINIATWDVLSYFGVMDSQYRNQFFLGFLRILGTTTEKYDYGILPYSYSSSGDVWNMNPIPISIHENVFIHSINGILWATGHPPGSTAYPPNVQPLGVFPLIQSGIMWKGGLLVGTKPAINTISIVPPTRYSLLCYIKLDDIFKLRLPPAKAIIWYSKQVGPEETSLPLVTEGWKEVTILFKSNTPGDLTIQVDPDGRANIDGWEDYITKTPTTKEIITIQDHFARIRLKFSSSATVTAKAYLTP